MNKEFAQIKKNEFQVWIIESCYLNVDNVTSIEPYQDPTLLTAPGIEIKDFTRVGLSDGAFKIILGDHHLISKKLDPYSAKLIKG